MFKNFKPALLSLGLAALLTGGAAAQNVGGYSHVQQQRIHNREHGIGPNPYIYNNNARVNNNSPYYNNNRNPHYDSRNNNNDYYYDGDRYVRYPADNRYRRNDNRDIRYNNNRYIPNRYDNGRGINVGPLRINY